MLLIGVIGTSTLLLLVFLVISGFCYDHVTCMSFFETYRPWHYANYILITPSLFLFSLITYRMREEVFQAWWMLTRWWVPVTILMVFLLPSDNVVFLPIDKAHVSLLMSGLYFFLSTAIVLLTSAKLKRHS